MKQKRVFKCVLLLLVVLVGAYFFLTNSTSKLQANAASFSITNGSFESPVGSSGTTYHNHNNVPGWRTTATDELIEIWRTSDAASGSQFVELNGNETSSLYQDIPTTPGTTVFWSVSHRGRLGVDVAEVRFGPPGNTVNIQRMSTSAAAWVRYSGAYTIPAGQTMTRFEFSAVSSSNGNSSVGNFLDNVFFTSDVPSYLLNPSLDVVKTASATDVKVGDVINYTLEVNNTGVYDLLGFTLVDAVQEPSLVSFNMNSIRLNGVSQTAVADFDNSRFVGNTLYVNLPEIKAGAKATITYSVTVITPPNPFQTYNITNFATIDNPFNVNSNIRSNTTTSVLTPVEVPDVSIMKSTVNKTVLVGDEINYEITLKNNGNLTVSGYQVSDVLDPALVSYVANSTTINGTNAGANAVFSNGTLLVNVPSIIGGAEVKVAFKVNVLAGAKGKTISNEASLLNPSDPTKTSNTVTTDVLDATITKAVSKNDAIVNDELTYTLTITNNSAFDMVQYYIEDTINVAQVSFVAGSITINGVDAGADGSINNGLIKVILPALSTGDSAVVAFKVNVLAAANGLTINNKAKLASATFSGIDSNTVATNVHKISHNKTVSHEFASVNDELTYTISVNNESSFAISDYFIEDQIDLTLVSFVANSITINGTNAGSNGSENNGLIRVNIPALGSNSTTTISFKVKVLNAANGLSIANYAVLNSAVINAVNSNTVTTFIPNVEFTKQVSKQNALVDDILTYTISLVNQGSFNLVDYFIEDDIDLNMVQLEAGSIKINGVDAGTNGSINNGKIRVILPTITAGATLDVTFNVKVLPGADGKIITNFALLDSPSNIRRTSNEVTTNIHDVNISKEVSYVDAVVEDILDYTIKVNNNSDFSVNGYIVEDTVDLNLVEIVQDSITINGNNDSGNTSITNGKIVITLPTLTSKEEVTIVFKVKVLASAKGKLINNYAQLQSPFNTTQDSNLVTTRISNIELAKAVSDQDALVNDVLTYTISVNNKSEYSIDNYYIEDVLDTNLVDFVADSIFINGVAAGANGSLNNGVLTINLGTIASLQKVDITYKVTAKEASNGKVINNVAVLESGSHITVTSNKVSTNIHNVNVAKNVSHEDAFIDDNLTYTITIKNNSEFNIDGYIIEDTIDTTLVYLNINSIEIDGVKAGSNATFENSIIKITLPTLSSGQESIVTFEVVVLNAASGKIINNQAQLLYPFGGTKGSEVTATRVPNIDFTKAVSVNDTIIDDTLTYTLSIDNKSSFSIENYTLEDVIDLNLVEYVDNSMTLDGVDAGSNVSINNGVIKVTLPTINSAQKIEVVFSVKVLPEANGKIITNQATIENTCGYKLTSNEVSTNIHKASISIDVSHIDAYVNDILTYTLTVTNDSEFAISGYYVEDTIDLSLVEYVDGSIKIDGATPTANALIDGANIKVTLPTIGSKQDMVITFEVKVLDAASGKIVYNQGQLVSPFGVGKDSEKVFTRIPNVEVSKEVNVYDALVEDTLTYTLRIDNKSAFIIDEYTIEDKLDTDLVSFIEDSLMINGVDVGANLEYNDGLIKVTLPSIDTNEIIDIIFSVKVLAGANGQIVNNNASLSNETGISIMTNDVYTNIHDVDIAKTVSLKDAVIEDTLTYTINVTNNSIFPITDYLLEDVLDLDLVELDNNSILINGEEGLDKVFVEDGTIRVSLPKIDKESELLVTFDVKVLEGANGKIITNHAVLTSSMDTAEESNAVATNIHNVSITKEVSQIDGLVDDVLMYTITVENNSEFMVDNYSIIDEIESDLIEFIDDSVTINGDSTDVNYTFENSVLKVTLPPLESKESVVVSFDAKVKAKAEGEYISNTALLVGPALTENASNTVVTYIPVVLVPDLNIIKEVGQSLVKVGEKIDYKITIINNSNLPVDDYYLEDVLDMTLVEFVTGFIKIDGITTPLHHNYINGVLKVDLPPLEVGEKVTVEFSVNVLNGAQGKIISNIAKLKHIEDSTRYSNKVNTAVKMPAELPRTGSTNGVFVVIIALSSVMILLFSIRRKYNDFSSDDREVL